MALSWLVEDFIGWSKNNPELRLHHYVTRYELCYSSELEIKAYLASLVGSTLEAPSD